MYHGFLDVSESVFNGTGECVLRNGLNVLCGVDSCLSSLCNACSLESGYLNDLAAQLLGELADVDLVAVLLYNVHHVDGDDNGDAQLCELSCKVEVSFKVRTVNDVEYSIGTFADEIISCNDFFKSVW